jgi:hypothetical protein
MSGSIVHALDWASKDKNIKLEILDYDIRTKIIQFKILEVWSELPVQTMNFSLQTVFYTMGQRGG